MDVFFINLNRVIFESIVIAHDKNQSGETKSLQSCAAQDDVTTTTASSLTVLVDLLERLAHALLVLLVCLDVIFRFLLGLSAHTPLLLGSTP